MRLLLDSCVWGPAADEIRAAGHDVNDVKDWGGDPGDKAILQCSVDEDRILVTLDKDFGSLVFAFGQPHRGIVRLVNIRASDQGRAVLDVLNKFGTALQENALIVVEAGRIRIRTAEAN